jgi:flagellar assembly protein FliH
MTAFRPFRFERDFDAEPRGAADGGLPPNPIERARRQASDSARHEFEARLQAVREAAFAQGLAEGEARGRAEAEASIEARSQALLENVARALPRLSDEREADAARFAAAAGAFLVEVVEKLLPGLEANLGEARLERFLIEALKASPRGARLLIEVQPGELASTQAALQHLGDLAAAPPIVVEAAEFGEGEVRVSWEHGGMALVPAKVAEAILEACKAATGLTPAYLPRAAYRSGSRPAHAGRRKAASQPTASGDPGS